MMLLSIFAVSAVLLQGMLFLRVNILRPIVLIGTFALAMAFAANDLVNFIGVPMAGYHAYKTAAATDAPLEVTMDALSGKVQSDTLLLLVAGAIMVGTLWISRKARSVTETSLNLGQQSETGRTFRVDAGLADHRAHGTEPDQPGFLPDPGAASREIGPAPGAGRGGGGRDGGRGPSPVRPGSRFGQPDGGQRRHLLRHVEEAAAVDDLRHVHGRHGHVVRRPRLGPGQRRVPRLRRDHRHRRLVHDGAVRVPRRGRVRGWCCSRPGSTVWSCS